jgi:polyisoprenyl-phosphate glycosyltransferase
MVTMDSPVLSIVVPAYNESAGIGATLRRLAAIAAGTGLPTEIIVVDDGSRDETYAQAAAASGLPVATKVLGLSRNFGKEGALLAGLREAAGEAVITIDADLQHPPELIPDMIAAWRAGACVVNGVKRSREQDSALVALRARVVNALLTRLGEIDLQRSSDFKLLDRRVVDVIVRQLPERNRLYRGLSGWVGFPQVAIEFDVAPRTAGASGFSLRSLLGLTLTAVVSFTSLPLRIVSVLGVLTLLLGLFIGGEALWTWLHGRAADGFTTVIITLLLVGSFIMISLGVIGEYIAKIYEEIKQRPAFIVGRRHEREATSPPGT